jgi:hypothetical protein
VSKYHHYFKREKIKTYLNVLYKAKMFEIIPFYGLYHIKVKSEAGCRKIKNFDRDIQYINVLHI